MYGTRQAFLFKRVIQPGAARTILAEADRAGTCIPLQLFHFRGFIGYSQEIAGQTRDSRYLVSH